MDVGTPLVAHPQSAKLVQPGQGSFHHPPVHPQPAAVLGPPPGQGGRDVAGAQVLAMLPGVIGPVGVEPLRTAAGSAALPPHRRHSIHQGQWVASWRLAPVRMADNGVPLASVSR